MRPAAEISTCRASHHRIIDAVARMTDAEFGRPSLLPGYTRGHVVAHLINKTTAHVQIFEAARVGEIGRLHPEGHDPDAVAELGARRSASAFRSDLAKALGELESAWRALNDEGWRRQARMTAGLRSMGEVVAHHLRNVEVHHVDLDIGYRPCDWPSAFVEVELAKRLSGLAGRADHADLLAWLLDRGPAPTLGPW